MPRISIKGQVFADLVAKFAETPLEDGVEKQNMNGKSVREISFQEPLSWKVYINGVAKHKGSGMGLVLIYSKRITIEKSLRLGFLFTNNEAEYETLLVGKMVQKMGGKAMEMFFDSRLVVGQVQGELEAREPRMHEYFSQVRQLREKKGT